MINLTKVDKKISESQHQLSKFDRLQCDEECVDVQTRLSMPDAAAAAALRATEGALNSDTGFFCSESVRLRPTVVSREAVGTLPVVADN